MDSTSKEGDGKLRQDEIVMQRLSGSRVDGAQQAGSDSIRVQLALRIFCSHFC